MYYYLVNGWCLFIPEMWDKKNDLFPIQETYSRQRHSVLRRAEKIYEKPWKAIYAQGARCKKVHIPKGWETTKEPDK